MSTSSPSLSSPGNWRRIGLTGGIASGKSTVSRYLEERYGLPVLDADLYARQAVAVGSPILQAIRDRYGAEVLQVDGSLDRQRLAQILFGDVKERRWLEGQIHPFVRDAFVQELVALEQEQRIRHRDTEGGLEDARLVERTAVLAIPLLFEAGMTDLVSEVWVVSCPLAVQVARLMGRDRISEEAAKTRIASQMPLAEKVALADVVLDNGTSPENLFQQVDSVLLNGQ